MALSFNYEFGYYPWFSQPALTTADSISNSIVLTVYPDWYTSINLKWSYPSSWGSVRTNVYHSANKEGPYVKLTDTPLGVGINSLNDTTTQDFSKIREGWYVVEALLSTGKRIQSLPNTWRNRRSNWVQIRANEINRREWLLLRKFTGVETYLFSRKTYGKRCDNCWSYTYEKVVKDKCLECYGTSFDGGYWNPTKTLVQFETTPNDIQLTYFGQWEINEMPAWTIAFPSINQRDLLYRLPDGKIFEVNDVKQTELQTQTVRQIFKITELSKDSIEYKVVTANNLIPT